MQQPIKAAAQNEREQTILRCPKLLLLTDDQGDVTALQALLREHAALTHVRGLADFRAVLERDTYDAVLCSWSFLNGTWKDALEKIGVEHPDLPLIVLSRSGAEQEWIEVIEAGAFDLLVPPYGERQVFAIVEHASASRQAARWHAQEAPRTAAVN